MPDKQIVPLLCLGVGKVGGELLRQVLEDGNTIAQRTGLSLVPIVIADSSGALVNPDGLSDKTLQSALEMTSKGKRLQVLPDHRSLPVVKEVYRPGMIVIDLTASSETMPILIEALESGCGVVLANKIPLTGPWQQTWKLFENPNLRYECTVGAGLPMITTLRYLLDTGDQVTAIEGCFSGTLGYLCSELERTVSFSDAVQTALEKGYTEPDPRDDLSGKDVARKALILARTAGWPLSEEDIEVKALHPKSLSGISRESFLSEMSSLDEQYRTSFEKAEENNQSLRYVARITPAGGEVGLVPIERNSPLGALQGPANYLSLQTRRYFENPLVISGPGAGPEVTAAGVIGDVIKLAQRNLGG